MKVGNFIKTNQYSYSSKDKWEYIYYLDTGNITENRIDEIVKLNPLTDKIPSRAKRKVKKGNIIYSTVRPNQKHYGYVDKQYDNLLVSTGFVVIDVNEDIADGKYFYYWLTQEKNTTYLQTIAENTVATYPSIAPKDIENMSIELPLLDIQRKIAKILSNYDDLVENNSKRIKILEEMAQKIYKEWFVDFKYPGHETATFKDTELGKIPSDWEVKNLSDFVNVLYGYAFKSNLFTDKKDKIPVVRIRDIKNQKTDTYTSEVPDDKYYIKDKEILIGMDGEFHMCNWLGGRAYLNQRVAKLKPKDNQSYYYLFLLLQKPIKDLNIAIQGTTVAHLGDNHLRMLYFAIPNEQILEKFNFIVEKFLDEILNLTKKNKVLNEAKSLLLPRLMSGEIDVMDLDIN